MITRTVRYQIDPYRVAASEAFAFAPDTAFRQSAEVGQ